MNWYVSDRLLVIPRTVKLATLLDESRQIMGVEYASDTTSVSLEQAAAL